MILLSKEKREIGGKTLRMSPNKFSIRHLESVLSKMLWTESKVS